MALPKDRWQKAAAKLVSGPTRKISRSEWRGFGDRMIRILRTFDEVDGPVEDPLENRGSLVNMFRDNENFAKQCLLRCLEKRQGELQSYIDLVNESVVDRRETPLQIGGSTIWERLFEALFEKAVEMNNSVALNEALSCAHDSDSPKIQRPWTNSRALIRACMADNIKLVNIMLRRGYRLRSGHFDKKKNHMTTWKDLHVWTPKEGTEVTDEVQDLHVLRAQARPCYILGCYTVTTEKMNRDNELGKVCPCCKSPIGGNRDSTPVNNHNLQSAFQMQMSAIVNTHFCPNHIKYTPVARCTEHPACNDPIFRCFELSQVANKCAKRIPEYREEYREIAGSCNKLAVQLLEQCNDTNEVELLLKEKTGSSQYFRNDKVKKIIYPRLNMAIENNHKAFVGHMFCQQILRSQWHGQVPWHNRPLRFKALYAFIQVLLTFWNVLHYLTRMVIKDLRISREAWRKVKLPLTFYEKLTGPCNLDEPLNRFINYTGMFLLFWGLIVLSVVFPIANEQQLRNNFHWYHWLLLLFTFSMIIQDITLIVSVRSISNNLKFWRVYDLGMHFLLCGAFLARLLMGKVHPCPNEECSVEVLEKRIPFDTASNCLFSFTAVLAGMRLLYWFQLHDRIGPIVINMSRVVVDIVTFAVIFLVSMVAFVSALVPLKAANDRCNLKNLTDAQAFEENFSNENCWTNWNFQLFWNIFLEMGGLAFWAILNPESTELFDTTKTDGAFALIIFGVYVVIMVIIVLNLLIALMNATISKLQDRQHLYWKFVRTSIWIDFFGEDTALPQPFNVIYTLRAIIKGAVLRIISICKKQECEMIEPEYGMHKLDNNDALEKRKSRVREHNSLMSQLVTRYWRQIENEEMKTDDGSIGIMAKVSKMLNERLENVRDNLSKEILEKIQTSTSESKL